MDIHKPKPWHGVRELLKEIGTIVIGVLIALAAEQGVEWLHWHERAAQAEAGMRQDAKEVLANMLERLEIQDCQDRRLNQMRDRLLVSGQDWTPMAVFYTHGPPKGSIYAHPMKPWPRTAWLNAVASGAATHLSDEKLKHFSMLFAAAEREVNDQTVEHEASSELNVLGLPLKLTPDNKVSLLRAIAAERARNRVMGYEAHNSLPDFTALGFDVEKARVASRRSSLSYAVCVESGLAAAAPN